MKFCFFKSLSLSIYIFLFSSNFAFSANFNFNLNPPSPTIGDRVIATLDSFDLNLDTYDIAWFIDNKMEKSGRGLKSFAFNLTRDVVLSARITSGGNIYNNSIRISGASVDLLWEVVGSYEPPFYRGKILPISDSFVRVVALPQKLDSRGFIPSPNNFIYGWQRDDSNVAGQSGFGRNSFTYQVQNIDRQNIISVNVGGDGSYGKASATVSIRRPEIHFYQMDSALGPMYNKVIQNNQTYNTTRVGIVAVPYFMFTNDWDNPSLISRWTLNGQGVSVPDKNFAFFESPIRETVFNIGFSVDNQNALLQSVSNSLRLNIRAND